jgi:DNA-binding transcriptional LysR family regulator
MIETDLLDSFGVFGETLNFTHAAKRLGLSQPALFERIQKLGESLALTLYTREGRTLALTPAGTRLLAFARDARAHHASFLAELRSEQPARKITLAAGEGAYLYLLGPGLRAFTRVRANAATELELLTLGAKATVEALRSGDAQLGVAVLDLVPATLVAKDLVTSPLAIALRHDHPLAKKRGLRLAHFANERFVLTPEGQLHRDHVSRALAVSGHTPRGVLEADGWPLMLKFVEIGLGVAVVNAICHPPKGVTLRPLAELGTVTYRLLARRNAPGSPEAQALASALLSSMPTPARLA